MLTSSDSKTADDCKLIPAAIHDQPLIAAQPTISSKPLTAAIADQPMKAAKAADERTRRPRPTAARKRSFGADHAALQSGWWPGVPATREYATPRARIAGGIPPTQLAHTSCIELAPLVLKWSGSAGR